MSDCEWDAPHDEARFCVTHECWAGGYGQTCPLADARVEVEALRTQVQAVREACDKHNARTVWGGDGQTWSVVDRDAVLRALDGGDA